MGRILPIVMPKAFIALSVSIISARDQAPEKGQIFG